MCIRDRLYRAGTDQEFFSGHNWILSERCSCSGLFWRISSGEYTQNESDNARCIYCDRLSDRTCGIFSPDVYTVLGSVLSGKKECQRILQSAY